MVQEILRERDHPGFDRNEYGSRMGGGGGGGGIEVRVWFSSLYCLHLDAEQAAVWRRLILIGQVPVPRHSVGVVIGRSGEMIKKIQNDAGVRIQFKPGLFLNSCPTECFIVG